MSRGRPLAWAALLTGTALAAQAEEAPPRFVETRAAPLAPTPAAPAASATLPGGPSVRERALAFMTRMHAALGGIAKLVEEARADRDIIKLNCLNEKLTAVKGLVRISEQSVLALVGPAAPRDQEASERELDKLAVAERKCAELRAEADACIGGLADYTGTTQVEMVEVGLPADDATAQTGDVIWLERPPAASPYQ